MVKAVICGVLLAVATSLRAEVVKVGISEVEVPVPAGYVAVPAEMSELRRLGRRWQGGHSVMSRMYVSEADYAKVKSGELPTLSRFYLFEIGLKMGNRFIDKEGFVVAKEEFRKLDGAYRVAVRLNNRTKRPGSKEDEGGYPVDLEATFAATGKYIFRPHIDNELMYASSFYERHEYNTLDHFEEVVVSYSHGLIRAPNRAVIMRVVGTDADLEWTREAIDVWGKEFLAANNVAMVSDDGELAAVPEEKDGTSAVSYGISGGILALIMYFMFFRKRDTGAQATH